MNGLTRFALLIVVSFTALLLNGAVNAQDGNNFAERYRENFSNDRYSNEYRENYRNNFRFRPDSDRRNPLSPASINQADQRSAQTASGFYSSVMKSPRRTVNLPSSSSGFSGGGGMSGSAGSGFNPLILSPPSLLRFYLSGNFSISGSSTVEEIPAIEIDIEPPEEITILSPSELLFEEGVELFRQKRYLAAARNFRHLLDIHADDASKAAAYSLCRLAMRDYDSAAEWMNKADSGMEDVEDLYALIQNIYTNKNEFSVHFKQLETKMNSSDEDEKLNDLAFILQSVNERY